MRLIAEVMSAFAIPHCKAGQPPSQLASQSVAKIAVSSPAAITAAVSMNIHGGNYLRQLLHVGSYPCNASRPVMLCLILERNCESPPMRHHHPHLCLTRSFSA